MVEQRDLVNSMENSLKSFIVTSVGEVERFT